MKYYLLLYFSFSLTVLSMNTEPILELKPIRSNTVAHRGMRRSPTIVRNEQSLSHEIEIVTDESNLSNNIELQGSDLEDIIKIIYITRNKLQNVEYDQDYYRFKAAIRIFIEDLIDKFDQLFLDFVKEQITNFTYAFEELYHNYEISSEPTEEYKFQKKINKSALNTLKNFQISLINRLQTKQEIGIKRSIIRKLRKKSLDKLKNKIDLIFEGDSKGRIHLYLLKEEITEALFKFEDKIIYLILFPEANDR